MKKQFFAIFICLQLVNGQSSNSNDNCCEEYCLTEDEEPYIYFGTKTSYEAIDRRQGSSQQHLVPNCRAIQFWSLIRHGTRYPHSRKIAQLRNLARTKLEILKNYEQKRTYPQHGKLCPKDFNLLRNWHWNESLTEQRGSALTRQGIEDMKLLARRFRAKFPHLFQQPYSERNFYFQYADSDRTHDSYQAFIEGLFGADAFKVHANIFPNDTLLQSTDNCNNQDWSVPRDDASRQFTERQEFKQITRDVLARLGFRFVLNSSIINNFYDMCRYDKAITVDQQSPWCVAFTKSQLKLLEYAEDLKYFYRNGPGNENSKSVGCAPLRDMFERFQRTISGTSDGNLATFFFSQSATLQSFLTTLGIVTDEEQLTPDNYYRMEKRKWRTSKISPFGANFAAALYECDSGERHRVMFFLNEIPLEISQCSVGLCNWSVVRQKFQSTVENCGSYQDTCYRGGGFALLASIKLIVLLIVPLLMVV